MNEGLCRFRGLIWAGTIVYWSLLAAVTHLPATRLTRTNINDKVAHFTVYAILAVLIYLSLALANVRAGRAMLITLIVTLVYGVLDEQTQKLVGRICSLNDWIADAAGAISALAIIFMTAAAQVRLRASR